MHSGDRHVLSSRLSSFWSYSLITDTASSIGTLVNREDTSKLTIISSDLKHTLLTVCMKCVEFFMYDCVLPFLVVLAEKFAIIIIISAEND